MGVKRGRRVRLTTSLPSASRFSRQAAVTGITLFYVLVATFAKSVSVEFFIYEYTLYTVTATFLILLL
jgi:hypothetical protein